MNLSLPIQLTTDPNAVLTITPNANCHAITYQIDGEPPHTFEGFTPSDCRLIESTAILINLVVNEDDDSRTDQTLECIRQNLRYLLLNDGEFLSGCIIASICFPTNWSTT